MKWPAGISSAGLHCGIKPDGLLDLGLLVSDAPAAWAGTFTRNAAAAAPVQWSRALTGKPVRAIVANSGNANACTGRHGEADVRAMAEAVSSTVGCSPEEVLVASTGPIGVPLPIDRVVQGIPAIQNGLSDDANSFSRSILTTDTCPKEAMASAGDATVCGVAKGAAMCAPNMATMLAFLATDASVDPAELQEILPEAVERSFNRISIDACESTNDSVFLLSSGTGPTVDATELAAAVNQVCASLAEQIVRDAEGASRVMRIVVEGAADEPAAAALGRGVADSVLWRCAVNGADPNWGRVLSALGSVDRDLELAQVSVSIGSELIFDQGEPTGSLAAAAKAMDTDDFSIVCTIGSGPGSAEILSTDISAEYVKLNAEGTS